MCAKLEKILSDMTPEEYELVVGRKSEDPLRYAFSKKRVVHPGVRNKMVPAFKQHAAWIETMKTRAGNAGGRTAYIHIPFCSKMCLYCGFFQNYSDEERETIYIDHLIAELKMARREAYVQSGLFNAVFIGGGTPSVLSPQNAARLLQAIRQCLPLANDCELTLEARVHDLSDAKIEAWLGGGVNRISVGVQSFDTAIRRSMGRLDTRETIVERLRHLASHNQAVLIVDLMFGLPGQSTESFLADLKAIDELPIDGMDLYQLNLFDVSPLKKAIDAGSVPRAATTTQQAAMFAAANEWLGERAYVRLSNCHWAKSSRERNLYNLLTKQGAEVFPFGAGAGGNIAMYTLFQQRDLKAYLGSIAKGIKPMMFMGEKSPLQDLHNDMLKQLEQGYFNLGLLAAKYGEEIRQIETLLAVWEENGLMVRGNVLSRLTVAGRFWHMNIAQSLLECAERLLKRQAPPEVQKIAEQG